MNEPKMIAGLDIATGKIVERQATPEELAEFEKLGDEATTAVPSSAE